MNAKVRDVMTDEVVAVRRDASYKEMAARLRRVQGVVAVSDKLAYPPPERPIAGLYF